MNRKKKGWEGGCPAGTDWGAFKTNTSRDTKTVFSPKGTTSPLSPPGGGERPSGIWPGGSRLRLP